MNWKEGTAVSPYFMEEEEQLVDGIGERLLLIRSEAQ